MELKTENIYTSVACNRTPESADWGKNGLIIFAAANAIAIFDPKHAGSAKITRTYVRHSKKINTVKWIPRSSTDSEVLCLSGSDDGKAILWDLTDFDNPKCQYIIGHESGINVVEGICINESLTLATASTDSTIKLWHLRDEKGEYECFQTIPLETGFCFALRMTTFPKTKQILLTFAGDNDNISLLTEKACSSKNIREFIQIHDFIGHEDWVRCLDFIDDSEDDLLLASSSQDHFIRLWRISTRSQSQVESNKVDLVHMPEGDIHVEEKILQFASIETDETLCFATSLESVLHGHEGWVYGVNWNKYGDSLQLLSCSIDKTMIVWSCADEGVWMEKVRVGEVGGNLLGFYGGKFASDGKAIFGHGYQGSFHIWHQSEDDENLWTPDVVVGGHFNEVRDICWEPKGQFFFSVSGDATTRIHAPWVRPNKTEVTWHEIARPQVHGYDMQCITALSTYKFASGAEEKIVRTFQAPGNFIQNFRRICGVNSDEEGDQILETLPKGASVPSLGLSNKAVYDIEEENFSERHVKDEYPENYFVPIKLTAPPQEETLMQNTLWPEVQKLYGHGFEIFAICSSADGKVLASACRAQNAEHAQIILWDTSTWKQIKKLPAHKLTVTQMKFSPNRKYLLSVSRDRSWALFENKSENELGSYEMYAATNKTNGIHTRIIWSCDWSHDSDIFVTTSRDGKAVAWRSGEDDQTSSIRKWKALACLNLEKESITAVAIASKPLTESSMEYLVAFGFESGLISLYSLSTEWKCLHNISNDLGHHLDVRKLQFRPQQNDYQLASCGSDHFVRVFRIKF